MANRLKEWRKHRGLTLEQVADRLGTSAAQVHKLEAGKLRLKADVMAQLAEIYGCEAGELIATRGAKNLKPAERSPRLRPQATKAAAPSDMMAIEEVDVRAGAGNHPIDPSEITKELDVRHTWQVPTEFAAGLINGEAAGLRILTVVGDSMYPDLHPMQKVVVDTHDKRPSPPGIFIVWDGIALVAKRVQFIPHSDPPKVKLSSSNKEYDPYERLIDEAYIQGRIVGRWQPT